MISFPRIVIFIFILLPAISFAQPELTSIQKEWVNNLKSGDSVSDFYWQNRSLIYSKIQTPNNESFSTTIKSGAISGIQNYTHEQTFRHDSDRFITIGTLNTEVGTNALVTGWRKVDEEWKKEIDVILSISETFSQPNTTLLDKLDQEREKWVKLANQHNPENHIRQSYTKDATYFGNGQKSEGRTEIAERYFYMENANYQVDLEKEQIWSISEDNILEIGRYFTGPEKVGAGGIYVILWQQQEDGNWRIELDFNF